MKNRWLIGLAVAGAFGGVVSAVFYSTQHKAQAPAFQPTANPYPNGVYANGIIQSDQDNGTNTAIYPEVAGTVIDIPVKEGQAVKRGDTLLSLDASVQRATTEQLRSQAEAARATLAELKAQPRPESLAVVAAQVDAAAATVKLNQDTLDKLQGLYDKAQNLISKEQLDNATNEVRVANANLTVARRQYELAKAGAWSYEVQSAALQVEALDKAYGAAAAQLDKYTVRAPVDGRILAIEAALGSYVSAAGTYNTILGGNAPLMLMGGGDADVLSVRCYVDEILIQRLALDADTPARLFVRGTDVSLPLQFVRVQPYVSPKIELSSNRTERVDLRVLPVIFRLSRPPGVQLYPGQLVDVYIGPARAAP